MQNTEHCVGYCCPCSTVALPYSMRSFDSQCVPHFEPKSNLFLSSGPDSPVVSMDLAVPDALHVELRAVEAGAFHWPLVLLSHRFMAQPQQFLASLQVQGPCFRSQPMQEHSRVQILHREGFTAQSGRMVLSDGEL